MSLLHYRLRRCGFRTVQFTYPTIHSSLKDNAARLQRLLQSRQADRIHFVAHSLGGLLLRQFFHDFPAQRPGRVVTLGTPHQGSVAARRLGANSLGKTLLGRSYNNGLRGDVPAWKGGREMLVIAGSKSIGVGRLVARLPKPNDGTVTVQETRLATADKQVVLPVTHMGMLFSSRVARLICQYLRSGRV